MTNSKIFTNIFFLFVIIISYISLLCFISNEGLKDSGNLPRHGAMDTEMINQNIPVQEADFDEIQINKNLIDIE